MSLNDSDNIQLSAITNLIEHTLNYTAPTGYNDANKTTAENNLKNLGKSNNTEIFLEASIKKSATSNEYVSRKISLYDLLSSIVSYVRYVDNWNQNSTTGGFLKVNDETRIWKPKPTNGTIIEPLLSSNSNNSNVTGCYLFKVNPKATPTGSSTEYKGQALYMFSDGTMSLYAGIKNSNLAIDNNAGMKISMSGKTNSLRLKSRYILNDNTPANIIELVRVNSSNPPLDIDDGEARMNCIRLQTDGSVLLSALPVTNSIVLKDGNNSITLDNSSSTKTNSIKLKAKLDSNYINLNYLSGSYGGRAAGRYLDVLTGTVFANTSNTNISATTLINLSSANSMKFFANNLSSYAQTQNNIRADNTLILNATGTEFAQGGTAPCVRIHAGNATTDGVPIEFKGNKKAGTDDVVAHFDVKIGNESVRSDQGEVKCIATKAKWA